MASFSKRMDGVTGSAIRELFKLTARPGVISFGGGNPSPAALPDDIVADISRELVATNGKVLLQYGMTEGLPSLREALVPYIEEEFQVKADPATILPVTGSTQAFNLLLDAYTDPCDVILTENPTFLGATQAMHLHQLKVVPVDSDDEGLRMDALEDATFLKCFAYAPVERESAILAWIGRGEAEGLMRHVPGTTDVGGPITYHEMLPPDASKGACVDWLRSAPGIAGRTIIAAGDYWNDYELLREADVAVAPSNAIDEIKAICRFTGVSNNEHLMAHIINTIIPAL